jgi:hypothetical protein
VSNSWVEYLFLILVLVLLVWRFSRRQRLSSSNIDVASSTLADINSNLQVIDEWMTKRQSKRKFHTRSWRSYKDKLVFLDPPIVSALDGAFSLAEDFNIRIDSARRNKDMATLQDMPMESLREPFTKGKEALVFWIRAVYHDQSQTNYRR